jgi:putative oxidoreductase
MNVDRYAPQVYAAFRVVFGFLFLLHGLQKFGMIGGIDGKGGMVAMGTMMGAAAVIETVGGLLIMIGLFTRPAAFIASGQMATAYFLAHQPNGGLPIQNMGELAVMFCFAFLYICVRGAGAFSADAAMGRQKA